MQSQRCPKCSLVNFKETEKCKRCDSSLDVKNYPESETKNSEWFYSLNGKRIGPLNRDSVYQLIKSKDIDSQTLVWQNGMSDWAMAYQTKLASHFNLAKSEPPPLHGEAVDNNIVWTIALTPLISGLLQVFASNLFGIPAYKFWWIAIILNISLCLVDENRLKNAGHNTKGMSIWAFLLIPVYLFIRASRLKQDNSYAIVWLITFFVSIFIF